MQKLERRVYQDVHAAAFQVLGEMLRRYPVGSIVFNDLTAIVNRHNDPLVLVERHVLNAKANQLRAQVDDSAAALPEQVDEIETRLGKALPALEHLFRDLPDTDSVGRLGNLAVIGSEMQTVFEAVSSRIIHLERMPARTRSSKTRLQTFRTKELTETLMNAGDDASQSFEYKGSALQAAQFVRRQSHELIRDWTLGNRERVHTILITAAVEGERACADARVLMANEAALRARTSDFHLVSDAANACDEIWLDTASTVTRDQIAQVLSLSSTASPNFSRAD